MSAQVGTRGRKGRKGCCADIACLHTDSTSSIMNTGFNIPMMDTPGSTAALLVPFDLCGKKTRIVCKDANGFTRVTDGGRYILRFCGTVMLEYNLMDLPDLETTPPNTIIVTTHIESQNHSRPGETNMFTVPNNLVSYMESPLIHFQQIDITEVVNLKPGDTVKIYLSFINALGTVVRAVLLNSETNFTVNTSEASTEEGSYLVITETANKSCQNQYRKIDFCQ